MTRPETLPLLVLNFDGLGGPWLGPYGNTWYPTPSWNRLAAESLLFETPWAVGPDAESNYEAAWSTIDRLDRESTLMTDAESALNGAGSERFTERVLLESAPTSGPADEADQTRVAGALAAAAEWLEASERPDLLWLHAAAFYGPWDAPYAVREMLADEGDPDPPHFVEPPRWTVPKDHDPDELFGYVQAHAAQSVVIDRALGALLDVLDASRGLDQLILIAYSPRGYALGEHGEVGGERLLHSELLHGHCLVRFPGGRYAAQRSQRLLPPAHLAELLQLLTEGDNSASNKAADDRAADHMAADDMAADGEAKLGLAPTLDDSQQVAFSYCGSRWSVRTPAWFLTEDQDGSPKLYAKPGDRWEVNEVASLCPNVVEQLEQLIADYRQQGDHFEPQLSDLLRRGYEDG